MFGEWQENIKNAIELVGDRGQIAAQIRLNNALIASLERSARRSWIGSRR